MDNPGSDVGSVLGAVALLILVVTILLSLALSLVARRRYIAAVVRLQGRGIVGSNPSESLIPVLSPLRIVISISLARVPVLALPF